MQGLPASLDRLLMYLLTENTVKSWNYYGGDDSSTLSIKWQHNIDTENDQLQRSLGFNSFGYKKKSPAQFKRDAERLEKWKQEVKVQDSGFDNFENKSSIFTCHGESKVVDNSSPIVCDQPLQQNCVDSTMPSTTTLVKDNCHWHPLMYCKSPYPAWQRKVPHPA